MASRTSSLAVQRASLPLPIAQLAIRSPQRSHLRPTGVPPGRFPTLPPASQATLDIAARRACQSLVPMIARAFGSSAVAAPAAAAAGGALRPAARRVPQVGLVQSAGVVVIGPAGCRGAGFGLVGSSHGPSW